MGEYTPRIDGRYDREWLQGIQDDLAEAGVIVADIGEKWNGDIVAANARLWRVKRLIEAAQLKAAQMEEIRRG